MKCFTVGIIPLKIIKSSGVFFFVLRKNTQENMVISDHYIIITENNSVV